MSRLAEYLAALAKMLGYQEHTHFVRVDPGSARLVHKVDPVDAPKVERRLDDVRTGGGPKDALAARQTLEDLLANDNAIGALAEVSSGRVIIPFVGRDRPKTMTFPPFRQDTVIYGQVVNIGGRDNTAHATLQDGELFHVNVSMRRDLARDLARHLYGPPVRLRGNGRFERLSDGTWKMLDFRVDGFETLEERPFIETLAAMRAGPSNGLANDDIVAGLLDLRNDEEGSN
jgi:hypothetical protein